MAAAQKLQDAQASPSQGPRAGGLAADPRSAGSREQVAGQLGGADGRVDREDACVGVDPGDGLADGEVHGVRVLVHGR